MIKGRLGRRFGGGEVAGFDIFGSAPGTSGSQPPPEQVGGAIIIATAPGEFIIAGKNMSIDFAAPNPGTSPKVGILLLERGTLKKSTWVPQLRLNGDELRITLAADKSKIFKLILYPY